MYINLACMHVVYINVYACMHVVYRNVYACCGRHVLNRERERAREIVVDRECRHVFHRHVGGGDCGCVICTVGRESAQEIVVGPESGHVFHVNKCIYIGRGCRRYQCIYMVWKHGSTSTEREGERERERGRERERERERKREREI